jgi:N-acetylglucosaminyldiphosphoundecaprenol N-acetyl-beta-D-mannosaminyltransferase
VTDFNRPVHCILGLPVDALDMDQAARQLEQARSRRQRCFLSTPNLNFIVASQSNALFRESVCQSDLSLADGMPLVWIARLLGIPLPGRVSGSGLFEHLRSQAQARWKVFLFGGQRGVGQDACLAIGDGPSGMIPTGYLYPGMGSVDEMSRADLIDCINHSGADLLLVSLGAAKGQEWIRRNLDVLDPPVVSHLGAVINFVAGRVARAPRWMQDCGLEWLWRIQQEPQLYRRYLHDGLALLRLLLVRVLPLMLWQRWGAADEQDYECAEACRSEGPGQLKLRGAWRAGNLAPLRRACAELLEQPGDATIDLAGCTDIDSAWVALMLLLGQALHDRGNRLRLLNPSPRLRRLLHLHCAAHLCAP